MDRSQSCSETRRLPRAIIGSLDIGRALGGVWQITVGIGTILATGEVLRAVHKIDIMQNTRLAYCAVIIFGFPAVIGGAISVMWGIASVVGCVK